MINYGFVWGENENPTKENSDRIIYSDNIKSNKFSTVIETTLKEGVSYFVRAFVETDKFVVYGENVSFFSLGSKAPEILSISPLEGTVGDTLRMTGSNFSYLKNKNEIYFNDIKADVLDCSDSIIYFAVPEITNKINSISISISGNSRAYSNPFISTLPQIESVFPQLVSFQDTIEINGNSFSYLKEANKIMIGNTPANVIFATKTRLKLVIPSNLMESTNILSLKLGGREVFFKSINIKPPKIESIDIPLITEYITKSIIIKGENFNELNEKNTVLIGNESATIISSSKKELVVDFPRELIPRVEVSVFDTLDIMVNVLDQSTTFEKSLIIDYQSTWTRLKNFPGNPRMFGAHFSIGDKAYIGLGSEYEYENWYKDFWLYDSSKDAWTRLEDFPGEARSKFASFVIGESVYIICGTTGNQNSNSNNLSEVWEFNSSNRTWIQKNDFPGGARYSSFGFSIGNYGYAGGGIYGDTGKKYDFWKYDPKTDNWTQLNDILNGIINDITYEKVLTLSSTYTAYVIGDKYSWEAEGRYFWEYDAINDSWIELNHFIIENREMVGFNLGGKIYSGLGTFSSFHGNNHWLEYDISSDNWSFAQYYFPGNSRMKASSFTIGEVGYILLGQSGCHCANLKDVWKFDPTKPD